MEMLLLPATASYLAPDGSQIRELLRVRGASFAHCLLPAGQTAKAIRHKTVEEIWYITRGLGQIWRKFGDREEIVDLFPGVCVTIPVGTHFQFRNTSADSLEITIATSPPWPGANEAQEMPGYWTVKDSNV